METYANFVLGSYAVTAVIIVGIAAYAYIKLRTAKRHHAHLKSMLEPDEA